MARYAFVRREMPNYQQMRSAGWDTPLFAADDPRLSQQIAGAKAAGMQYGIWADPNWYQDKSPEAFARQMAQVRAQYGPSVIVPDIEFIGKGYQGSQGWDYNNRLAQAWKQYLPGQNTAITPMGMQSDFNYGAWKGLVSQWLPQAYGADSLHGESYDPQKVAQVLIDQGVDPKLIAPVMARTSGQYWNTYKGQNALWTYDDEMMNLPPAQRAQAERALQSAGIDPSSPIGDGSGPDGGPAQHIADANNPRAVAYANMRLAQAKRLGLDIPTGMDPTAAWRQVSQGVAGAAQQAGMDPRSFLRSGNAPSPVRTVRPGPSEHGRGGPGPGPRRDIHPTGPMKGGKPAPLRPIMTPLGPGRQLPRQVGRPAVNVRKALANGMVTRAMPLRKPAPSRPAPGRGRR